MALAIRASSFEPLDPTAPPLVEAAAIPYLPIGPRSAEAGKRLDRPLAAGLAISLLFHLLAAVWGLLTIATHFSPVRAYDTMCGASSITLVASIASPARQSPSARPLADAARIEVQDAKLPAAADRQHSLPQVPQPSPQAVEKQPAETVRLPQHGNLPPTDAIEAASPPTLVATVPKASSGEADPKHAIPPAPRADVRPPVPPTVSLASPAPASTSAQASQGADSIELPRQSSNPPPVYPTEALAAGQTGRVVLVVRVGVDGLARDVRLHQSSGVRSLDEAALTAVARWRFEPGRRAGAAVEMEVAVPVRFLLAVDR